MSNVAVQELVSRIESATGGRLVSKRMFGGITFLLHGNMLCCASTKGLMVRVGADAEDAALTSAHATPCMGAGRRMAGFIMIDPAGITDERQLQHWIDMAWRYVETLPAK